MCGQRRCSVVSRTCGFGAAPQDETRPREPLRAASLKAAAISEPKEVLSSLSHMRLRSRPVPLRRMKLVHGSRSGRLRSKLLQYQSRSLPHRSQVRKVQLFTHRSQVRKVQLFTHCSPKNFTACNFVATKRDPTAYKNHSRDFSRSAPGTSQRSAPGTLQGLVAPGLASARDSCSYTRVRVRAGLECSLV